MRIANFKHNHGDTLPLGRWLFSFEIMSCPAWSIHTFRPLLRIVCTKIIREGEYGVTNGRPTEKRGGWWTWSSPYGVHFDFEIVKY